MTKSQLDVVGIGNAIVDILARADDSFLARHGIAKDVMQLIDEPRAIELTSLANGALITSGGSGANTIAGVASFGGRGAYIGRVRQDKLGAQFIDEMTRGGVAFHTRPQADGPATARSIIFVTPDGHRSMNTYLGASVDFSREDVDPDLIAAGTILYLEGYLFDKDAAKQAFVYAAETAKAAGRKVAVTLSDRFCVERHRASFRHLVSGYADIVFANEAELLSLYETNDFAAALDRLRMECPMAAVTRSEKGSVVLGEGPPITVPAEPVAHVADTTGAGDQYAAGFLMGVARGLPLATCARLGAIAAAEVISHMGPRPETSYAALAARHGIVF